MSDEEIILDCEAIKVLADKIIISIRGDLSDQQTIKNIILNYFNISEETFLAHSRKREESVVPRGFFYLFCKALLPVSLARIGVYAGHRDHATVLNGIRTLCNLMQVEDKEILSHYDYLLNVMEGNGYSRKKITDFVSGRCKR